MATRSHSAAIFGLAAAWLVLAATAQSAEPDALVKTTSEEVLAVIKQTSDRQRLLRLAEEKVAPHFDFAHMTQLAVGKSWRQATPEQRQRLEKEFRDLLVRTYTNAVAAGAHTRASIRYKPLKAPSAGADEVVVRTQVIEPGKPPIDINYTMASSGDGWKVYDVTVDNVSLVTNYRGSFASSIGKGGIDGLIAELEQKNQRNRAAK